MESGQIAINYLQISIYIYLVFINCICLSHLFVLLLILRPVYCSFYLITKANCWNISNKRYSHILTRSWMLLASTSCFIYFYVFFFFLGKFILMYYRVKMNSRQQTQLTNNKKFFTLVTTKNGIRIQNFNTHSKQITTNLNNKRIQQ